MPTWLVDFGRWFGGLLVFAMCAALSAAALIPCALLFMEIEARTSTLWAVVSVPFLYGLWGALYCMLCVLYKRLIRYRPRAGEHPLFSAPTIGWATTGALTNWANTFFLQHWKGTPWLNLYLRLMGAKIGRRVSINTIHIYEWDLITIEDEAVLGGDCMVQGHLLENGRMKMRPVHIGKKALIGSTARVMPGCSVGDLAVVAAASVMKKDTRIPANEIWGGTPCRLIRARGERDAQDDGVRQ